MPALTVDRGWCGCLFFGAPQAEREPVNRIHGGDKICASFVLCLMAEVREQERIQQQDKENAS